jgi:Tol biopolymer transport system component
MFCIACATHNPATLSRCATCGTRLSALAPPLSEAQVQTSLTFRRSRKRHLLHLLTVLPILVMLAGGGLAFAERQAEQQSLESAYRRAETALAAGDYTAAIAAFADAGAYRDAVERKEAITAQIAPYRGYYLDGVDALAGGDYDGAIAAFGKVERELPGFEDAAELLVEARKIRTEALLLQLDEAEVQRDWLLAERLLGQLLADDPDNAMLRDRLYQLSITHAPIVFARNGAIYTIGPDSLDERLISDELHATWPTWSPDKTRIAFYASIDDEVANYALFVVDADGSNVTQLVDQIGLEGWIQWSPDGTRIAYTSVADFTLGKQEGVASIHIVDVASRQDIDYTSGSFHFALSPSWSPDSTRIAFVSKKIYNRGAAVGRRVEGALHMLDSRTGQITDIAEHELPFADYVTWSPAEERLLIYSSEVTSGWSESMITTIAMYDVATGVLEKVTNRSESVSIPAWSPDGSRFAFTEGSNSIQIHSVNGAKTWVEMPRAITPFLSWSPDGSRLLAPAYDPDAASIILVIDEGRTTIDFKLVFDFAGVSYGPPQWSAANPLEPVNIEPG